MVLGALGVRYSVGRVEKLALARTHAIRQSLGSNRLLLASSDGADLARQSPEPQRGSARPLQRAETRNMETPQNIVPPVDCDSHSVPIDALGVGDNKGLRNRTPMVSHLAFVTPRPNAS